MKRFLLILAALCVGAVAAPASAQTKVAVVNLDRIMHESKQSKDAERRLESQFKQKQAELTDVEANLRKDSDNFEKNGVTMSEAQRRDGQNKLADRGRDLQRRQRDLRDEYGQRNQAEVAEVFSAANRAIKSVAEKEGIDVVFQEVAYANPKIDITDKVLKAMSDGAPVAK